MINFACLYPQVFGKYVLERELSRGGMARVVLATLRGAGGFEKRLVVKQIRDELAFDQQFVRRFVEEAKTTVALSHPNIVPVYELGVEQGTYFLAMELVEGLSVADLLRERNEDGSRRVLSPEEGAYVGIEVCRALDYAHRRMKVVHRDITPRNVMIDDEGQIKLIDFGIAAPALVAGHEILGSPGHMPPEQVEGLELGPPTDIFAVAVLLMEAWTGSAPFRRATPEECSQALRAPHPRPSDFDPRLLPLDDEMDRAMREDPRARHQEASDLARALRGFLQGADTEDIARALGERVRRFREEGDAAAPPSRVTAPRPSQASHGDLGTQTFAAREEALSWSHPPAAMPLDPEDDEIPTSTRKIDESATSLPSSTPTPRIETKPAVKEDPSLSIPTPLMVDIEQLEKVHAQIAADAPVRQMDIPTVRRQKFTKPLAETTATTPVETIAPAPPRTTSRAPIYASIVAGFLALGGLVLWRTRPPEPVAVRPTPTSNGGQLTVVPSAKPVEPAPPASVIVTPPPVESAPARPAPSIAATKPATVQLLGEPGTRVTVDGAMRGACPARVTLDPGTHDVRFLFDPTGESRGERVTVKSGETLTVRADFTGATPTIKIQR